MFFGLNVDERYNKNLFHKNFFKKIFSTQKFHKEKCFVFCVLGLHKNDHKILTSGVSLI